MYYSVELSMLVKHKLTVDCHTDRTIVDRIHFAYLHPSRLIYTEGQWGVAVPAI